MPISIIPVAPAGSAEWGEINGDIANQSDLTASLDGKAAAVHTHEIADINGLQDILDELLAIIYPHP
jgi:hypothetical protein